MKDFLKNHGLWILFAGAVIAVALALLSYFSTNASPLVDLANTITSPFRAVCTSVSGWFTDKQNYYEDVTALKAENEALKKQIAEMEATVRQGEAASQENVFLRDLLDLRPVSYTHLPLVFTRVEHLTGPDRGGFGSTGK